MDHSFPSGDQSEFEFLIKIPFSHRPKIVGAPKVVYGASRVNVDITVESGEEEPKITWRKGGKAITLDSRFKPVIKKEGANYMISLAVENVGFVQSQASLELFYLWNSHTCQRSRPNLFRNSSSSASFSFSSFHILERKYFCCSPNITQVINWQKRARTPPAESFLTGMPRIASPASRKGHLAFTH